MDNKQDYTHFINLLDYMRLKTPAEQAIALKQEAVRTMAQRALEEIIYSTPTPELEPPRGFIEGMRRATLAQRTARPSR